MKRTNTPMLLASLLVLSLLALVAVGCDGTQAPDSGATDTAPDNGDTLPYTEPDMDSGGPGMGDGFSDTHGTAVMLQDNRFVPDRLEVEVGDTVTFFNGDTADHDIEVGDVSIGRASHGDTLTWTAEASGTYPLICTIHPQMTGEIVVR